MMVEVRGRQTDWTTADIMLGRMLVGGPTKAKYCPTCHSPNVSTWTDWAMDDNLKCSDCGGRFGGASARA